MPSPLVPIEPCCFVVLGEACALATVALGSPDVKRAISPRRRPPRLGRGDSQLGAQLRRDLGDLFAGDRHRRKARRLAATVPVIARFASPELSWHTSDHGHAVTASSVAIASEQIAEIASKLSASD